MALNDVHEATSAGIDLLERWQYPVASSVLFYAGDPRHMFEQ